MDIQAIKQNLLYLVIAVIIYFLLSLVRPQHPFDITGIVLPATQTATSPSSEPVQLLQTQPFLAKKIAYINLEAYSASPSPLQENALLDKAKALTQKAGGNGLVIQMFGYEGASNNNPAPLAKYILFGTAVKTN